MLIPLAYYNHVYGIWSCDKIDVDQNILDNQVGVSIIDDYMKTQSDAKDLVVKFQRVSELFN